MPIHLYAEKSGQALTGLEVDEWDLPTQLDKLCDWVIANQAVLNDGPYVADIGFMIREEASGGGAVLSSKAMKVLSEVNMSIYFSEYQEHNE